MRLSDTINVARTLDKDDPLGRFRNEFHIPSYGQNEGIYFLGNSLGLQPRRVQRYADDVMSQWAKYGVEGFFHGEKPWMNYHRQLLPALADIVGAKPCEVSVMNQLTVNLHLMLVSFYRPVGKRNKILCEAKAFPSDQYVVDSHVRQRGFDPGQVIIEIMPRDGETSIREEDVLKKIEQYRDELSLVLFGGVNYYSGQVFDMKTITAAAHRAGAKSGFDLAHAAGNVRLHLHDWGVDFACWCSYKYLNSGPGAIAGVYVHEKYHEDGSLQRFAGWWGNKKDTQFLMNKEFDPELTAEGWQLSTPSPLLFAIHMAALDLFTEAGFGNVLAKNKKLNDYLWSVLEHISSGMHPGALRILTPSAPEQRGCQVSLAIRNGKKVFDELAANGVFADWREPDVIRVAPVGLYNTFEEVWQFGQILRSAIDKFSA